jgi:hypothetical protein
MTVSGVISSLIKQLLFHLEAIGKAHEASIQDSLNKAHRYGRTQLVAEEGFEMMLSLAQKFSKVFIMLDGLDECNTSKGNVPDTAEEATRLLRFAKRLLGSSSKASIKLFLSSRFEVDVRKAIPSCLHVSLSQDNVTGDIVTFVEEEVEDKIWAAGCTEDYDLVQDIKRRLILGAQGM